MLKSATEANIMKFRHQLL